MDSEPSMADLTVCKLFGQGFVKRRKEKYKLGQNVTVYCERTGSSMEEANMRFASDCHVHQV